MLLETVEPLGVVVITLVRVVTILVTPIATEDSTPTIIIVVITIIIVVVAADLVLVIGEVLFGGRADMLFQIALHVLQAP